MGLSARFAARRRKPNDSMSERPASFVEHLGQIQEILSRRWLRNVALVAGLILFVGLTTMAIGDFPGDRSSLDFYMLGAAGLVTCATALLLAAELGEMARLLGDYVPFRSLIGVALVASAANLLPLPGSLAVRTGYLAVRSQSSKQAFLASVVTTGMRFVISCVLLLAIIEGWWTTSALGAAAVTISGVTFAIARRLNQSQWVSALVRIAVVEIALLATAATQLWFIIRGLGSAASASGVIALTAVGSLSATIAVLPAGLGVREALFRLVAPIVAIGTTVSVLASAVERLLWTAFLATASLIRLLAGLGRQR